ncbi:MAG: DUF3592 domain-containing protein [Rhodothermia bacterium]|nr:DUF3592 domain-containing protein [Rhodothermia bacterium]
MSLRWTWGIFALIGLPFMLVGLWFGYDLYQFSTTALRAEGEVVDMARSSKGSAAPIVAFRARDGQMYEVTGDVFSSPPSYHIGEKATVKYQPSNPNNARISDWTNWLFPGIFGTLGTIFTALGLGGLIFMWRKKKMAQSLQVGGQKVRAKIEQVAFDTSLRVNGRSPYVIWAQWQNPRDQKVYQFKSDYIWYNPTDYLNEDSLTVFIDPKSPEDYHIDLSFLPQVGN